MLRLIFFLMALALLPPGTAIADLGAPAPFVATYAVSYRGFSVGRLRFEFRTDGEGRYVYESHARPRLLARLFVGSDAVERSVMRIDADGVRPLSWFMEDGKTGDRNDGALTFAWGEGKVFGTVKGERIELPTEPGLQDSLSFQIAVMTSLLRGREPGTIPMVAEDEIKRYGYVRAASERIRTEAGEFDTVLYVSTRRGSSRVSYVWHAPALGWIPVRAEQVRKGRVETVMELVKVRRSAE